MRWRSREKVQELQPLPPPDADISVEIRRLREHINYYSEAVSKELASHSRKIHEQGHVASNLTAAVTRIDAVLLQHGSALDETRKWGEAIAVTISGLKESIDALRGTIENSDRRNTDFHTKMVELWAGHIDGHSMLQNDLAQTHRRVGSAEKTVSQLPYLIFYLGGAAILTTIAALVSERFGRGFSGFWSAFVGD